MATRPGLTGGGGGATASKRPPKFSPMQRHSPTLRTKAVAGRGKGTGSASLAQCPGRTGYSPPGSKHLVPGRWSMLQIPQGVSQLRYSHGLQVAWGFHTKSSFEWHRVEHQVFTVSGTDRGFPNQGTHAACRWHGVFTPSPTSSGIGFNTKCSMLQAPQVAWGFSHQVQLSVAWG